MSRRARILLVALVWAALLAVAVAGPLHIMPDGDYLFRGAVGVNGQPPLTAQPQTVDLKQLLVNLGFYSATPGATPLNLGAAAITAQSLSLTATPLGSIACSTAGGGGCQFATGPTQQMAFFGTTPAVQFPAGTALLGVLQGYGLIASGTYSGAISTTGNISTTSGGGLFNVPTTQTLATGGTIAADACGGLKRVSSAANVILDGNNSLAVPAGSNLGCGMDICNTGTFSITLNRSANFVTHTGATTVVLAANYCVRVTSDSVIWRQMAPLSANS